MSKMVDIITEFVENQEEIYVVVPGIGKVFAKIESIVDDVVTLALTQKLDGKISKVVLHYTQLIILRD